MAALQSIFAKLPGEIIQGLVNAILNALGLGNFTGTVDEALAELETNLSYIPTAIAQIGQIFAGEVVTAVNDGVNEVKAWFNSVGVSLPTAISNASTAITDLGNAVFHAGVADASALGTAVQTAGSNAQGVINGIVGAAENTVITVDQDVTQVAAQLGSFFTGLYNKWTGGSASSAGSSDVQNAANAAAAAQASHAALIAAIQAQLPHFYGGSGTAGIDVQVSFSGGTLPSEFTSKSTIATNSAEYNVTASDSDEETVSAIWSSGLSAGDRYLILRADTTFNTYVYARISYDSSSTTFTIEIGCVNAGTPTVLGTYTDTGFTALATATRFANNLITLEATDYTFTVNYPGLSAISYSDSSGSPVSQKGSAYRNAGYGTNEASLPGSILTWSFYDNGPSAGPATAIVTTSESTTSTSYTDLATTTDQVTINVGPSGMILVIISCFAGNSSASQGAYMSFALSGANTVAAADGYYCGSPQISGQVCLGQAIGNMFLIPGLSAGATTVKAKYRSSTGTATYQQRHIAAIPL